MRIVGKII